MVAGSSDRRHFISGQLARPKPEGAHQRTMHHQIGIAANGRGEMGVGAARQAEMPDILRRVIGLGLASEYMFHHLRADVAVAELLQDAVEGSGLYHLSKRKGDVEGLPIILERDQLLAARRRLAAVTHR